MAEQTTQHTATVFLSYRRKDLDQRGDGEELSQVERIEQHLKACGLHVWRDLTTMKDGVDFEADVAQAIADCDVFLLYLTPRTVRDEHGNIDEHSYIWQHEVRDALARAGNDKRSRIMPIYHGVDFEDVKLIIEGLYASLEYKPLTQFQSIQLPELGDEPLTLSSLHMIALRVLATAFEAHLEGIGADPNYEPWIHFWAAPDWNTISSQAYDLELDWHNLFNKRTASQPALHPSQEQWRDILLPALSNTVSVLSKQVVSRIVHIFSKARLSAAVAFGFEFRQTTGFSLRLERIESEAKAIWSTSATIIEPSPLKVERLAGFGVNSQAGVAIVEVVATPHQDTSNAVEQDATSLGLSPKYRVKLKAERVNNAGEALAMAQQIRQEMLLLRSQKGVQHFHLFIVAPVELAILLGYHLNATGNVTVYEFANNHYVPGPTLSS